ncbi:MAG: HAD-IA family hydrolase [Pseudomonadales bacterium]|nr:HAD-IA family hydrolase [Pseudomonadales bacterium]
MSREYDLVVFDWDGTLMDSAAKIVSCMQSAARDEGIIPPGQKEVEEIIGLGLPQALERLFPSESSTVRTVLQAQYSTHYAENDKTHTPFFPGVEEGLAELGRLGYTLAVATGKSRRGLDRVLNNTNVGQFFSGSRCADETASKPDPLMLYELMDELACAPERVLMVGDTEYDMEMARNAGVVPVAVSYGVHDVERLHAYHPRYCVDEMSQLIAHLSM